jgi:N4-gp56 family major capsid protein
MGTQTLNSPAQRIGRIKGEILAHAMPTEVLSLGVTMKSMPKNGGETIVYRRWLPFGAAATNANTINRWSVTALAHLTSEGVTPTADVLVPQDISVTMNQYACLYSVTDKTVDMSEDGAEIPGEMKKQTGERMGLVREMVRYGALKACSNKFYAGGTTRATVDEKITLPFLRKITRGLKANHAKTKTSILSPSPNYGTSSVEAAYLVFAHTDCENDIRDLPGFKETASYGQRKVISPEEVGSCEGFRFILSPELASIPDVGAAIGATGLFSTTGTLLDVYPVLVMAEDAAGDVALRGMNSLDPTWLPPGVKDKNDPLGQRGYIGAKFYGAALVTNDGWMAAAEVGVTAL